MKNTEGIFELLPTNVPDSSGSENVISSACSDMRWPRGTHTRSRIMHARAFRWEKVRREADGMGRAETRANISLCGSPCPPRAWANIFI